MAKEKILLVEDEEDILELIAYNLTQAGYLTAGVMSGEDKAAIEAKTTALMQASMKIGEMAYRKAQEDQAGTPDNAAPDAPHARRRPGRRQHVTGNMHFEHAA